jgi:cyclase
MVRAAERPVRETGRVGHDELGLIEVADGVHAYLQANGTWGYSNAGVVVGDERSLLVDTLFDLRLTQQMLDEMAPLVDGAPIGTVVNTHANGDHCYGNQLLAGPGTEFVASGAASREMDEVPPSTMALLKSGLPEGDLATYLQHTFGPFEFEGIDVPPITTTFDDMLELEVDGRRVQLRTVGPAHTGGDVIAWLPDERVLFAGDILFIGGTPIMWAGPIFNWIAACELIEDLDPVAIVPGHGPLTDLAGVRDVADYLRFVRDGVEARFQAGMGPLEASRDLDLAVNGTRFAGWHDRERLVVTVHNAWRVLDPAYEAPDALGMLSLMADDFTRRTA